MPAVAPWPPRLAGTPAVAVIEQAIARRRLSHSLLLQGEDLGLLTQVALAIADRLLNPPGAAGQFPPEKHPDCFHLRPTGRARMIRIGDDARSPSTMREFIARLTVSPAGAARRVGTLDRCAHGVRRPPLRGGLARAGRAGGALHARAGRVAWF